MRFYQPWNSIEGEAAKQVDHLYCTRRFGGSLLFPARIIAQLQPAWTASSAAETLLLTGAIFNPSRPGSVPHQPQSSQLKKPLTATTSTLYIPHYLLFLLQSHTHKEDKTITHTKAGELPSFLPFFLND
ncbi:hypothetical protein ONS95_007961 [Cadophora gregata]|uniref:uncharacterized protein n=1 Tax=Cadophora gregata TaxID=51156 RepID=UPI0026DDA5ED|nr:uncharacterized protein ONS95_007961 [Cadophora gregata]KAK0126355.1 hypothetical protein ONS95_007961 [Cadophora gregata]